MADTFNVGYPWLGVTLPALQPLAIDDPVKNTEKMDNEIEAMEAAIRDMEEELAEGDSSKTSQAEAKTEEIDCIDLVNSPPEGSTPQSIIITNTSMSQNAGAQVKNV